MQGPAPSPHSRHDVVAAGTEALAVVPGSTIMVEVVLAKGDCVVKDEDGDLAPAVIISVVLAGTPRRVAVLVDAVIVMVLLTTKVAKALKGGER